MTSNCAWGGLDWVFVNISLPKGLSSIEQGTAQGSGGVPFLKGFKRHVDLCLGHSLVVA